VSDITELEGWTALPEAAERLGLSRQGMHFRVNQGLVPKRQVRQVRTGSSKVILIADKYIDNELEAVSA